METKQKKILQIKKGEYLLSIIGTGAINTTYNIDSALDISNWSLEQLGHITGNLKKVGYKKAKVLIIGNVEDSVKAIGEITSETAKEIGEALKIINKVANDNE